MSTLFSTVFDDRMAAWDSHTNCQTLPSVGCGGGYAFTCSPSNSASPSYLTDANAGKILSASATPYTDFTFKAQLAIYTAGAGLGGLPLQLASFDNYNWETSSSGNHWFQLALFVNPDGSLSLTSVGDGPYDTSSAGAFLLDGSVQGIQVALTFFGTSSVGYEVVVNNATVLSGTFSTSIPAFSCYRNWGTLTEHAGPPNCDYFSPRAGVSAFDIVGTRYPRPAVSALEVMTAWMAVIVDDTGATSDYPACSAQPLTVECDCKLIVGCPTVEGAVGVAYASTPAVSCGSPAYLYSMGGGDGLPAGLSYDVHTGLISGTPTTEAAYTFGISVSDSYGRTGAHTCTITIGELMLTLTCPPVPSVVVSPVGDPVVVAYSPAVASGGTGPYLVSYSPSSGTLFAVGDTVVTCTVVDAVGGTTTCTFTVTVVSATRKYAIRRLRQTPHMLDEKKLFFLGTLLLNIETGVGLGSTGNDANPRMVLEYSDDGAQTWSDEIEIALGREGDYGLLAVVNRLGTTRDRVWRLWMTDEVASTLVDAYFDPEEGTS